MNPITVVAITLGLVLLFGALVLLAVRKLLTPVPLRLAGSLAGMAVGQSSVVFSLSFNSEAASDASAPKFLVSSGAGTLMPMALMALAGLLVFLWHLQVQKENSTASVVEFDEAIATGLYACSGILATLVPQRMSEAAIEAALARASGLPKGTCRAVLFNYVSSFGAASRSKE